MSPTQQHTLSQFVPRSQLAAMVEYARGEEKQFFIEKFDEYETRFNEMHKTYDQDGKGDEAIVHLHYFVGGADWYITEKDMEEEQVEFFGLVNLGIGFPDSLGYIGIQELVSDSRVQLDLHFTPCTMGELKAKRAK